MTATARRATATAALAVAALAFARVLPSALPGGAVAAAMLVGAALLVAPGSLLTLAAGIETDVPPLARPGLWFAASLGVLAPLLALAPVIGARPGSLVVAIALVIGLLGALAARSSAAAWPTVDATRKGGDSGRNVERTLIVVGVAALTLGAWYFTRSAGIDRWWYLAYVRAHMDAAVFSNAEPFFGSGVVVPRFGSHPWLVTLAVWASRASVDPVWLYERIAAPALVPLAASATFAAAHALFGSGRRTRLTLLATLGLWTGWLFPVVSRIPEDKILAAVALAPALAASVLLWQRRGGFGWAATCTVCAVALATAHPLVFAYSLLATAPFLAWLCLASTTRARAAAALALLAVVALYPAAGGGAARDHLRATGAELSAEDHPVVRVHDGRRRLLRSGDSYTVHPTLVLHAVSVIGLFSLPLVAAAAPLTRAYLFSATLVPLAAGYVPPLAMALGEIVLPWMVYRVLWVVPFAALAALGLSSLAARLGRGAPLVATLLVAVCLPFAVSGASYRMRDARAALALPAEGSVRDTFAAVAALPADSVVAAAPGPSERIAAVAGRRVLAAADRATVVFVGDRQLAERRLRARASIFNGSWQPLPGVPTPTHVLFAPGERAERYCGARLFEQRDAVLCEFAALAPLPTDPFPSPAAADPGPPQRWTLSVYDALSADPASASVHCQPSPQLASTFLHWPRLAPWSFEAPSLACTLAVPTDGRLASLRITPYLGRAVDELRVEISGRRDGHSLYRLAASARLYSDEPWQLALPDQRVEELELLVSSAFLPFVKLRDIEVASWESQP